jgi:hypothetical protein
MPAPVTTVITLAAHGNFFMVDSSSPMFSRTPPGHCERTVGQNRRGDALSDEQTQQSGNPMHALAHTPILH